MKPMKHLNHTNHNAPQKQLSEDVVEQFLKTQYQQALNQSEEIKLKARENELKADYDKKYLEHQTVFTYNRVEENRKTAIVYNYAFVFVLVVFIAFIWFCLYLGQYKFVRNVFQFMSYLVTIMAGVFLGRMSNKEGKEDNNLKKRFI